MLELLHAFGILQNWVFSWIQNLNYISISDEDDTPQGLAAPGATTDDDDDDEEDDDDDDDDELEKLFEDITGGK